ncbi:MAG: hypothetical protein CL678_12845, partial [Bdellovibrionaceae bacterium]|nr:hypothetical protein [Pseudobdellovibrionaceae bacterium]
MIENLRIFMKKMYNKILDFSSKLKKSFFNSLKRTSFYFSPIHRVSQVFSLLDRSFSKASINSEFGDRTPTSLKEN